MRLSAGSCNRELLRYQDSDWAGDRDTGHSTSGFNFTLASALVSWRSKLQTSVATNYYAVLLLVSMSCDAILPYEPKLRPIRVAHGVRHALRKVLEAVEGAVGFSRYTESSRARVRSVAGLPTSRF